MRVVLLLASVVFSGCWPMRPKPAPVPPPKPIQVPTPPPQPKIGPAPEIEVQEEPKPERELPQIPKAVHPARPPRPVPQPPPPQPQPQPQPAPSVEPPPPAPVPELVPLMSEAEKQAYHTAIDSLLAATRRNLEAARHKRLNPRAKDLVTRATAFADQANQLRQTDPAAAKSLAERAELMSRESLAH